MAADVQIVRSVLYFTYSDPLTLCDIETSLSVFFPMLNEIASPIHSIFNVTHLTLLPRNVLSTFIARRSVYEPMMVHPMRGITVIVTGNSLISSLTHIAMKSFSSQKVQVVQSEARAWEIIERIVAQGQQSEAGQRSIVDAFPSKHTP